MKIRQRVSWLALLIGLIALGVDPLLGHAQEADVPYVPTSKPVVNRMLEMANVDSSDIVYDLGSGDGRILIQAAKTYGRGHRNSLRPCEKSP